MLIYFFCYLLIFKSFKDLYHLSDYKMELSALPKMGSRSVLKLIASIHKSRQTTLDRFITALGINLIGKSSAKDIAKYCNGDIDTFTSIMENNSSEFTRIEGIGDAAITSLNNWWAENKGMTYELLQELEIQKPEMEIVQENTDVNLNGSTFCITGKLKHFANREALVAEIEKQLK